MALAVLYKQLNFSCFPHRSITAFLLVFRVSQTHCVNHARPELNDVEFSNATRMRKNVCNVTLNETSALILANLFRIYQPNFARLKLHFNDTSKVTANADVIRPFHWIWTFYTLNGLFSYLKWPSDFPIVSFGLLDARTLPDGKFLTLDVTGTPNCSLTIGEPDSVYSIAQALRVFTHNYLEKTRDENFFDYSYWCYTTETPQVKETLAYKLKIYLGFPTSFLTYVCCHTEHSPVNSSDERVICDGKHYEQNIESSVIPYAMSLIVFAYFPIALMKCSAKLVKDDKSSHSTSRYGMLSDDTGIEESQTSVTSINAEKEPTDEYVYLDGSAPISVGGLLGGCCGCARRFPAAASRLRRVVFVILVPCLIYVRLFVYWKFMRKDVEALLDHHCPLGYLSMLGGFKKSMDVFLPLFGGPYALLVAFYIESLFFLVLPTDINKIFEMGSERSYSFSDSSPLFFDLQTLEMFSHVKILGRYGYSKAAAICTGGALMLTNPSFWKMFFQLHIERHKNMFIRFKTAMSYSSVAVVVCVFLWPFLLAVCIVETILVVLLYGLPLINWMYILKKGFIRSFRMRIHSIDTLSPIINIRPLMSVMTIIIVVFFAYYVFSFCTIFTDTFIFLSKVCVFSFMSIIVYPNTSFGYLFFGVVLVYYVCHLMVGFGEGYVELLADAIEVSTVLEDAYQMPHLNGDTFIIPTVPTGNIRRLQLETTIINLNPQEITTLSDNRVSKFEKVRNKNYVSGIPRDLFMKLVERYKPVHIQITMLVLKLGLIVGLIALTVSIISIRPLGNSEGISEVMHVVFLLAIGALPKILEVALDNTNHAVKKEIKLKMVKAEIIEYWKKKERNSGDQLKK